MNIKKMFPALALGISYLFTQTVFAMDGGGSRHGPLDDLNYRMAFDQKAIHERFRLHLEGVGCAENVFGKEDGMLAAETHDVEARYMPVPTDAVVVQIESEQEAFEAACLWQLAKARTLAITGDARDAVTHVSLVGLGVAGTLAALEHYAAAGAMAGGFGILWVMAEATRSCRPIIKAGYDLAVPPAHALDELEKHFAKNQCFIPKALWPIIIDKFITARTSQFELRSCLNFIRFALGLTLYKPKPELELRIDERRITVGLNGLFRKIDDFFDDYVENDASVSDRWMLKLNVAKFVGALCGAEERPRYLYLHGLGGIGKTYFVNKLREWIEEIIPGSVKLENLVISTADELEGDESRPGALLCVLRNQLMEEKHGSVVFIDEATWLNRDDMVSSAKRVFNGDQSKIETSYFGSAVGGSGIELTVPPMLILVASNEEITDPALKSRFDTIKFPMPTEEKLVAYAREKAEADAFLSRQGVDLDAFNFGEWITRAKIKNFREIDSQIISAILCRDDSGMRHRTGAAGAARVDVGAGVGAGADGLV